jgi:hypothetical protein
MSGKVNAIFETSHTPGARIMPFEHNSVNELICELIKELNTKYMANLADPALSDISVSDQESDNDEEVAPHLIFVGGSHAARMAAAADRLEISNTDLSRPGLRITEASMESMAAELREVVESSGNRTIVFYHIFDNNVYFAAGDDGSRQLPVKIGDRYHIPGRLEYADRNVLKNLVNTSACLLRAGGNCEKFILSPLLRYLTMSCCNDATHMTNRGDRKKFIRAMAARNRDMKDELKDLIIGKRIRSFKVLSPNLLLLTGADEQAEAASLNSLWDEDPVHLVTEKYDVLVSALLDKADDGFTNTPANKHVRAPNSDSLPPHLKRQSWVAGDDTIAHRDYGDQQRGRGWPRGGRHRGRGGRGGQRGPHRGGGGRGRFPKFQRPSPY